MSTFIYKFIHLIKFITYKSMTYMIKKAFKKIFNVVEMAQK